MKALKPILYCAALASCFLSGLYGGPMLKSLYTNLFPEPEYTTGDFSALYAKANAKAVLYSTSTCPYCKEARALLIKNNLKFTEYLIDQDEQSNSDFAELGGKFVPILFIGDRRIEGFRSELIQSTISANIN